MKEKKKQKKNKTKGRKEEKCCMRVIEKSVAIIE